MEGWKRQFGDASSPSRTCTYLQEAVLKMLMGVWVVLQDWGLPAVKGLYGTIYRRRDPGWAWLGNPSTGASSSGTN